MINKSPPKTSKFTSCFKLFTYTLFGAVILILAPPTPTSFAGDALSSNSFKAQYTQAGYFQSLDNSLKNKALSIGTFIVAKPGMKEGGFAKSVILLVQHQEEGTWGVIINRPTMIPISQALPSVKQLQSFSDPLFFGGPMSQDELVMLIRSEHELEGAHHLFGELYISGNTDALSPVLQVVSSRTVFRAYAGSAGWAPGQLQDEVDSGDWWVVSADMRDIFDKLPADVWPDMVGITEEQHWVNKTQGFKLATYDN